MRWIALIVCFSYMCICNAQNLLRNGNFETVPNNGMGQGLLPSEWYTVSSSPDTYSNDGSYGLPPNGFGNFVGVVAHGGIRWIAGWNISLETPAQDLTTRLTPGQAYHIECWLHNSTRVDLVTPGAYRVELRKPGGSAILGSFAHTAAGLGWQFREFDFTAPNDAGDYPTIAFVPISALSSSYPGLDDVVLRTAGASFVGTVELQNYVGDVTLPAITIEFYSGPTLMQTLTTHLNSDGTFNVTTSLNGTLDVAIKATHWLRRMRTNVTVPSGGGGETWSLINGDCDGDNEVTLVDFGQLSASFGKAIGDPGYDPLADLDGDDEVTLVDYGIVSANFGQAGD